MSLLIGGRWDVFSTMLHPKHETLFDASEGVRGFTNHSRIRLHVGKKIRDLQRQVHVSDECVEFMQGLLHPDPSNRLKGKAVRTHSWFQMYGKDNLPDSLGPKITPPYVPQLQNGIATQNFPNGGLVSEQESADSDGAMDSL